MAYAEKRDGRLTGRWIGEVKGSGFPKRAFDTKRAAKGHEAYIRETGEEPPRASGEISGNTFKSVAQELKDAGGPEGTWANGKDPTVLSRLQFLMDLKSFGDLPIEHVTYGEAEKVVKNLAKRRGQAVGSLLADSTINRYLTALSSVMTYAEQKEYIERAPSLPWRKEAKKKQATYTKTMEQAVIGVLKAEGHDVDAFLVEVLSQGGMRVGELLNARPEQIEDGFVSLDDPEDIKNEDPREVYIGEANADKLRVLIRENRLPTYQQLYNHVRAAVKKCGYEVKRPLHAVRHTTATRTVNEEQDIQMAKELLGHKSIQTTLRYRHVSKDVRRARAKKLHPHLGKEAGTDGTVPEVVKFPKAS
ncbi:site-specific integrase [Bradyrhizobium sp. Ai1a-2]|uniref:tyrosine-type recombinase/integrase n=1 Tax=Bradyrhizobium sp. Ai1a-2 TaxID=196490 RepID=UPI00041707A7|nr:site-specific integrase [Bradyrhizobium sp. Ai1a-2]